MEIELSGIVIIVGNYGSGKTEVSVNLAVYHKRKGIDVRLADIDLVNPYFRSRETKTALSELGIDMVLPPAEYLDADLPILSPAVAGMIRRPPELGILDVGGDDAGATVLGSLSHVFRELDVKVFQVINSFRPYTDTIGGCLKIQGDIERASKLKISGIIGNSNLIDLTTPEDIYRGYDFSLELSQASHLPLECITVSSALMPKIEAKRFQCPLLPIERQLVPPWLKAEKLHS
jgi:hypothetical protein